MDVARRLGRYTLLGCIGRGGMAEVHLARFEGPGGFEKLVALKLLLPHLTDEPQFIAMFLDEARLAAHIDHPHVAQVIDLDCVDGQHFIVMEYVHGRDLRTILRAAAAGGGLPLAVALAVVRDACAGLHHAHELCDRDGRPLGLVHRDVSPQNLVVRYDGVSKLVDFGVAKASSHIAVTRTGVLKGKLGYFSPEQCLGRAIDRRSDVFALGVIAYEASTCMRLFHGDNEAAVLNRVVSGDFERPSEIDPDYPGTLEAVVLRALQLDPADRFASAQELLEALDDVAVGLGLRVAHAAVAEQMTGLFGRVPYPRAELRAQARPCVEPVSTSTFSRPARAPRRRVLLAAAGVAALLAMGAYGLGVRQDANAEPPMRAGDATQVPALLPDASAPRGAAARTDQDVRSTDAAPATKTTDAATPSRARAVGKSRSGKRGRTPASRPDKPAPGVSPDSMMPRG